MGISIYLDKLVDPKSAKFDEIVNSETFKDDGYYKDNDGNYFYVLEEDDLEKDDPSINEFKEKYKEYLSDDLELEYILDTKAFVEMNHIDSNKVDFDSCLYSEDFYIETKDELKKTLKEFEESAPGRIYYYTSVDSLYDSVEKLNSDGDAYMIIMKLMFKMQNDENGNYEDCAIVFKPGDLHNVPEYRRKSKCYVYQQVEYLCGKHISYKDESKFNSEWFSINHRVIHRNKDLQNLKEARRQHDEEWESDMNTNLDELKEIPYGHFISIT